MRVSIEKLRQRGARTEKEYTDELEQHGRDCGGHIAGLNWRWRWWNRWFHDGVGCRLHVGPFFLRHFFTLTYRLEVHPFRGATLHYPICLCTLSRLFRDSDLT